jgi:hypothetical protein
METYNAANPSPNDLLKKNEILTIRNNNAITQKNRDTNESEALDPISFFIMTNPFYFVYKLKLQIPACVWVNILFRKEKSLSELLKRTNV